METRLQYVLLAVNKTLCLPMVCLLALDSAQLAYAEQPEPASAVQSKNMNVDEMDSEFFELGVYAGILSVQDFVSSPLIGARATFHASEDFFLQFNLAQADVSESTFEKSLGSTFAATERDYTYFDLLLGYNLFQGEVFPFGNQASLSSLHVVAGVGSSEFGGEERFTYTIGLGYKVNLSRRYVWSVDLRDHIYRSSLLKMDDSTHNVEFSTGLSYLF